MVLKNDLYDFHFEEKIVKQHIKYHVEKEQDSNQRWIEFSLLDWHLVYANGDGSQCQCQ